ncbi:receptor-like serine/threonine-protein kinase ALE2 isoform X1 [Dioscorea cayenensis subsp. rotundata]|uniref:Receptor-like serine/threonine-protein kinase ALE2 isoform X1 n=1 Tax=Dioscorea cayennensis subsp. rotundata TaxID=55577 RepID=A0AB40B9U6_DIOCR|nr:receptor-like serine/threonine-protein kinase ALE2 isoform X1 [Dioscorea cayenensis subsp. rotundata]
MRVLVMILLSLLPLSSCDPGSSTLHINLSPSEHRTSPTDEKKFPLADGSHMLQFDLLSRPKQTPSRSFNFLLKVLNQARMRILGPPTTQLSRHERLTLIPSGPSPAPAPSPKHHGTSRRPHRSKNHRKRHPSISPTSFPPPEGQDCDGYCSEPLTQSPIGAPCGCVYPMQVVIDLSVPAYQLFPRIAELEVEVAAGTYLKQSQVRIMGANASLRDPEWTTVAMDLVPLVDKFDNMTALLTYQRFWQKKVPLDMSLFGDYQVIYVHYPGLPSSPPGNASSAFGPSGSHEYPFTANVLSGRSQKMNARTIAVIVLSVFIFVLVCFGVTCVLLKWRKFSGRSASTAGPAFTLPVTKRSGFKSMRSSSLASSTTVSLGSHMATCPPTVKTFSLAELEIATEKFSSKRILGEGGFGRVYHGIMDDGSEVAIKLLTREDQSGDREFIAEVEMLSRLHHRNLVKLIGICVEKRTRCLVYELIRNGSVESHLHGADKTKAPLDWEARMKIALGAARGLAYLHEDSNPRVIHRDFKASNVLLEEDFTPKVSDFGLAREASEGSHHISTRVMGTFGYVAPEYAMTGHLLVKSDVYSYGVVLLELLSGRKPVYMSQSQGPENLVTWARPLLTTKEGVQQLIDPSLCGNYDFDSVAKVAAIASMCVHTEASQRPFMGEVVQALKLICNDMDETFEDSYSQRESSSGPDCSFKGDFGLEHSWCSDSIPRLTYSHASPFVTMEYSSGPMEEMQQRHSANALVGRVESTVRQNRSGPLRTIRKKSNFYRLRGSMSEHGDLPKRRNLDGFWN